MLADIVREAIEARLNHDAYEAVLQRELATQADLEARLAPLLDEDGGR